MNENAYMAEFAENLWNNYIKLKISEELQQNVSYYKATVTVNPGDGTLTVQRPFDTAYTIRCSDTMKSVAVGTLVTVLVFGRGNATNHIAISADGMKDLHRGILPITLGGTGQTTKKAVRNTLGLGNTTGALPVANGGTGATSAANARTKLGIYDCITEIGDTDSTGKDSSIASGHIYWEKYNSGTLRIYGYSTQTNNVDISTSSWANGYESARLTLWGTWPVAFVGGYPAVSFRMVSCSSDADAGDYWVIETPFGNNSSIIDSRLNTPWFKMWRGTTKTFGNPVFSFEAVGRWK